jgi:two-component system chemotaxis response regulator CheY
MKSVLIVDDSATILMSLEGILARNGYKVAKAMSGEEAVRLLGGGQCLPDLIITDLNMGSMNGIALIRAVRAMPRLRFVPILMLTTESQAEKRQEAKQAGATGWLVKPVAKDDLLRVLGQVLPGA